MVYGRGLILTNFQSLKPYKRPHTIAVLAAASGSRPWSGSRSSKSRRALLRRADPLLEEPAAQDRDNDYSAKESAANDMMPPSLHRLNEENEEEVASKLGFEGMEAGL